MVAQVATWEFELECWVVPVLPWLVRLLLRWLSFCVLA
jgi:hypothetical protein